MKWLSRKFIIGIVILIVIYSIVRFIRGREAFTNVPIMTIPTTPKGSSGQLDVLNTNWRSILDYVSQNPDKSFLFIADIKDKFFEETCSIKQPRIDFANLVNDYRPVFK